MMDRVDLTDSQFIFCKHFLKTCNKGKGQNIHISVHDKNIASFLTDEDIYIGKKIETNRWSYWYENYKKIVEDAIRKSMMGLQTNYGFGWGDWSGQNRKQEIIEWEKRLKETFGHFHFLNEIKIDPDAFNYILKYSMDSDKKFSIIFTQRGFDRCPDLQKLTRFLELIGYKCGKSIQYPDSNYFFDGLEADKLNENKLIWDFI